MSISLSPRPEKLTITRSSRVNRRMRSKRPAKACADSSAGMMPSVRASNCAAFEPRVFGSNFRVAKGSLLLRSAGLRQVGKILRERHVDGTHVDAQTVADDDAELRGVGQDANLAGIADTDLQDSLVRYGIEIRWKVWSSA